MSSEENVGLIGISTGAATGSCVDALGRADRPVPGAAGGGPRYSSTFRSITSGGGSLTMTGSHYEEIPPHRGEGDLGVEEGDGGGRGGVMGPGGAAPTDLTEERPIGQEERSSIARRSPSSRAGEGGTRGQGEPGSPQDPVAGREQHGGPRGDREPETDGARRHLLTRLPP